jgi:hypothetical protein
MRACPFLGAPLVCVPEQQSCSDQHEYAPEHHTPISESKATLVGLGCLRTLRYDTTSSIIAPKRHCATRIALCSTR